MAKRVIQANDVDASTFQRPIEELAITLTHKVEREGIIRLPSPNYVVTDLGVIMRQAVHTYNLFYFLNSEEITASTGYRQGYSFAALPLIRTMIDCLYNTTVLLEDPSKRGPSFRKSGYRKLLQSLEEDLASDGGIPKWDVFLKQQRNNLDLDMRSVGITEVEAKKEPLWPTLSRYLNVPKGALPTSNQQFLKSLTFGFWDEYSSISHATFQGLKITAPFFLKDRTAHEHREFLRDKGDLDISKHLARAAAILLCIATELQAYFKFDGANINKRVRECWSALNVFSEVQELFNQRYERIINGLPKSE